MFSKICGSILSAIALGLLAFAGLVAWDNGQLRSRDNWTSHDGTVGGLVEIGRGGSNLPITWSDGEGVHESRMPTGAITLQALGNYANKEAKLVVHRRAIGGHAVCIADLFALCQEEQVDWVVPIVCGVLGLLLAAYAVRVFRNA